MDSPQSKVDYIVVLHVAQRECKRCNPAPNPPPLPPKHPHSSPQAACQGSSNVHVGTGADKLYRLQGMHAALKGCNALDLSQLAAGLAGMFSERSKGQQPPVKLLEAVEAHALAVLITFSPMVSSLPVSQIIGSICNGSRSPRVKHACWRSLPLCLL